MMAFRVVFGESLNGLDNHWGKLKRSQKQYTLFTITFHWILWRKKQTFSPSFEWWAQELLVIDKFWHIEHKIRFPNDFRFYMFQALTFREIQTKKIHWLKFFKRIFVDRHIFISMQCEKSVRRKRNQNAAFIYMITS